GDATLAQKMVSEVHELVKDRQHFVLSMAGFRPRVPAETTLIELTAGSWWTQYRRLKKHLRTKRVALAPVLFGGPPHPLRTAAFCLAPRKILAYNASLERHHLRLRTWIASLLFLRGVPVDRIYLRPRWLHPNNVDVSVYPKNYRVIEGRPLSPDRPRIAVLSP